MTNINPYSYNFKQEVEYKGRYFDNIREVAEENYADPGEEFTIEVELVPATGYYGAPRSILVRESMNTLGLLPQEDVEKWWKMFCALRDAREDILVNARIWTCPDWEERFYASVRLAMPSLAEAKEAIEDDYVELTQENHSAWKTYENFEIEHWDPRWIEAHGWTKEQIKAHSDRIHKEAAAAMEKAKTLWESPSVEETESKEVATTDQPMVDWEKLLTPDGTPRATPPQRSYVRAKVSKHYPGSEMMPRIDYATVGQCETILRYFNEDPAPLHQAGRGSMALWWGLMALVLILVGLLSIIPVVGPVVAALWLGVIVHHFVTRSRLKAPFGKPEA